MKKRSFKISIMVVAVMALLLLGVAGYGFGKANSDDEAVVMVPANFSTLAEKARPSVVNIRTVKTTKGGGPVFKHFYGNKRGQERHPFEDFFGPFFKGDPGQEHKQRSLGSGFIIDASGYIVTNNHVIEDADEIKVKLADDREFDAEIIGRDAKTDLALIRIDSADNLVPLKMGNSDTLKVGTWVVAIGSPFGLEQTVTAGIVSAKGRFIGAGPYDDFIQTDASINPGNSGGPLINMKGEVVGINTAIIASGQGIGFAIPIDLAEDIIDQLKTGGSVTRGWLGVGIQDLTPELTEYYGLEQKAGVMVTQAFEGDPAEKAGIKANDIITAVDGQPVSSSRELSRLIAGIDVGKSVTIDLIRGGKKKSVTVKIAKRPDSVEGQQTRSRQESMGLELTELTAEIARQLGLPENETGVVVENVIPESKADAAGFERGDVVKEIDRKPVSSIQQLKEYFEDAKDKQSMQVLVLRPSKGLIVLKVE